MKKTKYDCSRVLDFIHEYHRLCDTQHNCATCSLISITCNLSEAKPEEFLFMIKEVQNWSDTHPETITKKPVLSSTDKSVLNALLIMGYHWLAKDNVSTTSEPSAYAYAYEIKPIKEADKGWWINSEEDHKLKFNMLPISYNFSFLSSNDEEPMNIDWLLKDENIKNEE